MFSFMLQPLYLRKRIPRLLIEQEAVRATGLVWIRGNILLLPGIETKFFLRPVRMLAME